MRIARVAAASIPVYLLSLVSTGSPVRAALTTEATSPFCAQVIATNAAFEALPDPEDDAVKVKQQALLYIARNAKMAKLAPSALKADYKIISAYWAFQKPIWLKFDPKKPGALDVAGAKIAG